MSRTTALVLLALMPWLGAYFSALVANDGATIAFTILGCIAWATVAVEVSDD